MPPQEVEAEGRVETEAEAGVGNKARRARLILMKTDVSIVGILVTGPAIAQTLLKTKTRAKALSPEDNGEAEAVEEVTGETEVIEVEEEGEEETANSMLLSPTLLSNSQSYLMTMRKTLERRVIPLVMELSLIF